MRLLRLADPPSPDALRQAVASSLSTLTADKPPPRPPKAGGELMGLFQQLGEALAGGHVDAAVALMAADYYDAEGRTRDDMKQLLAQLVAATTDRRFILLEVSPTEIDAGNTHVTASVAWEAAAAGGQRMGEMMKIQAGVRRQPDGGWRIASLSTT